MSRKEKKTKAIELLPTSYQPSPKELAADLRIPNATPEALAKALVQDVTVVEKSVDRHRRKRG